MVNRPKTGLPTRAFFFTLDQVATMVEVQESHLKKNYIFFHGRNPGFRPLDKMLARNIAPAGEKPQWRVAEREVVRWLRRKGYKVYEQGWASE